MGSASAPGHPEAELGAILAALGPEYDHQAVTARRLAESGTLAAIVIVLLAFSLALRRAAYLAHLRQHEANTDQMTGLANRRRLFADLNELVRTAPQRERLAIGMFDLDNFKTYNDNFGHPAGDALLARLASKLQAAIGAADTAYRLGGDEFCVIAHGDDAEATLVRAQNAMNEQTGTVAITCSLGSIVLTQDQPSMEEALHQADQRLYNSKRLSRARRPLAC